MVVIHGIALGYMFGLTNRSIILMLAYACVFYHHRVSVIWSSSAEHQCLFVKYRQSGVLFSDGFRLQMNAFLVRITLVKLGMSNTHFCLNYSTLQRDTHDISKGTAIILWLLFACECCEFRQVYHIIQHSLLYFALSQCSSPHHLLWRRTHSDPIEWKSIQASLFNHSHHNQSLSNTTREQ